MHGWDLIIFLLINILVQAFSYYLNPFKRKLSEEKIVEGMLTHYLLAHNTFGMPCQRCRKLNVLKGDREKVCHRILRVMYEREWINSKLCKLPEGWVHEFQEPGTAGHWPRSGCSPINNDNVAGTENAFQENARKPLRVPVPTWEIHFQQFEMICQKNWERPARDILSETTPPGRSLSGTVLFTDYLHWTEQRL